MQSLINLSPLINSAPLVKRFIGAHFIKAFRWIPCMERDEGNHRVDDIQNIIL